MTTVSYNRAMTTVSMVSDVTDPVGDVMRFIRNFNEKYGAEHPTFYQGSYSQVCIRFIHNCPF